MAIKQRKQITGTTAQIKAFAGHEGVLAFDKQTKHLHVLSGTAGQTTELANKAEVTQGLEGKAPSIHMHNIANVIGLQEELNMANARASNAISKEGNRGTLKGYERSTAGTVVVDTSPDTQHTGSNVAVLNGTANATTSWTKVVDMTAGTVTLSPNWVWSGGKAPALKYPGVLTCHWNGGNNKGIASYTAGAS